MPTAAQLATIDSAQLGPLAGFRNGIINGNFDIWQRGTSLGSGTGERYLADRWMCRSTGSTYTAQRLAFTLGQTDVPFEPRFFHEIAVASVAGAGNFAILSQRIEGVRTFAGRQITVSFYAKAAANRNVVVELEQGFGSGGSPSAFTYATPAITVSLTTVWQRFTATFTVPSIAGKTIGTNNDDFLSLSIWLDAGSTHNTRANSLGQQSGTYHFAQVQVELGAVATPFERRPITNEIQLCQRYYCKSYAIDTNPGTATTVNAVTVYGLQNGTFHRFGTVFPVEMRVLPTVTAFNPNSGASGTVRRGTTDQTAVIENTGSRGTSIGNAGGASIDSLFYHYTANAEL
jgi:hypothetical protein